MNRRSISRNISVFVVGITLFMFEITLTRLFSTLMWYHFVFAALSLAMLGSTIGGVLAFKWLGSLDEKNSQQGAAPMILTKKLQLLLALAVSLPLAVLFLYKVPYTSSLMVVYFFLSAVPFAVGGYYLSLVFMERAENSNWLYFADLVGSAIGSLLIVILLDNFSLVRIGLMLALLPLFVYAFTLPKVFRALIGSGFIAAALLVTILGGTVIDSWAQFGALAGKPKQMQSLPGDAKVVYTAWNSLARTDVIETAKLASKIVLIDGGAASLMVPFDGNLENIKYLTQEVGYFPFAYKDNTSALVIGPGGGKDLLFGHLAGIHDLTAVELNPGSVAAARHFAEFNGNIYDLEGTKTYVQDGRNFIINDTNKYDLIFLAKVMTQASETLGYALSENYIYTQEAFAAYLDHLNPEGTLAFVLHSKSDLSKALATLLQIFEARGVTREEAAQQIVVVNSSYMDGQFHGNSSIMSPLLMVKTTPFAEDELDSIIELALAGKQSAIHLPGIHDQFQLIAPPEHLVSAYTVTDDYPFFYNAGKTAPKPVIAVLIGLVLIGVWLLRPTLISRDKQIVYFRNYFAYIGIGFMLIEVPLLQKLVLLFGHPTRTFSVVIAVLLLAAGIGSLLSKVIVSKVSLRAIGLSIAAYTMLINLYLPRFISSLQGGEGVKQVAATFLLLLPLGALMGTLFPTGIRLLELRNLGNHIPLMRAVNGWMSVVGSVLALVLAMSFGYNAALLAGAMLYALFAYHAKGSSIA